MAIAARCEEVRGGGEKDDVVAVAANARIIVDRVGLGGEVASVIGYRNPHGAWEAARRGAEAGIANEDVFPAVNGKRIAGKGKGLEIPPDAGSEMMMVAVPGAAIKALETEADRLVALPYVVGSAELSTGSQTKP